MYPHIIFVVGASGSGKTSTLKRIESKYPSDFHYCYFDHFGVPTKEELVEKFGSWENWGKAITNRWFDEIRNKRIDGRPAVLEGQIQPGQIEESCKSRGITDYSVVAITCTEDERKRRLIARKQPELITEDMLNWARLFESESRKRNILIIDNTQLSEEEGETVLMNALKTK